jgi:hypothetical protein
MSENLLDHCWPLRGKYHQRLSKEGANVVILEPDVASETHPDQAAKAYSMANV